MKPLTNRKSRRGKEFTKNPMDHQTIQKAVDAFLQKGGKITRIDDISTSYKNFVSIKESAVTVDEYLMGQNFF